MPIIPGVRATGRGEGKSRQENDLKVRALFAIRFNVVNRVGLQHMSP